MQCGQHWIFWVTQLPSCWTENILGTNFNLAEHKRNVFHCWLSIWGNNVIADWACPEMFKSRIPQPIEYVVQKSRVTGPWDPKDSVSAKKCLKNFQPCVCMQCGQHWIFWVTRLPSWWTEDIRGTFIAGWAYAERVSSLAEHARKCLKVKYLSRLNMLFKNLVLQALETLRIRFLQKKYFKKISCSCTFNEEIFVCSAANIGYFGWHDCHPAGQRTGATLGPDLCRQQGRVEEKGTSQNKLKKDLQLYKEER